MTLAIAFSFVPIFAVVSFHAIVAEVDPFHDKVKLPLVAPVSERDWTQAWFILVSFAAQPVPCRVGEVTRSSVVFPRPPVLVLSWPAAPTGEMCCPPCR